MLEKTALELAAAIKEKKLKVPDIVSACLEKIENKNQFNSFITVSKETALKLAKETQARIDNGEDISPLAGVPIALKDNISTMGLETTCASKMLGNYKPVFNAAVTEKLEQAGMIVIGKLNMDEFSHDGQSGVPGAVRNPWDADRSAGSCASAAAIAAGEVPVAVGTDSGGSLRQSCAFCGVTGIKPTYGSVSRHGIIAYASSLDQAGVTGQDIEDCAALLSIISGPDKRDGTCILEKPFKFDLSGAEIKGKKIGIPRNYLSNSEEDVKTAILAAAKEFEAAGAIIEEFEMPLSDYIIPAYCVISSAEVSSNLAKYDGLKFGYRSPNSKTLAEVYRNSRNEGFGFDIKRTIMLGSFVLSSENYDTYFRKALQTRTLIKETYNKLFKQFDMILSPVAPTTANKLNENIDDPMTIYKRSLYTASVNLAGLPAVSLPCGFDKQGLPIGFQLIGDAFTENKLIDIARIYQSRTNHHKKKGATT